MGSIPEPLGGVKIGMGGVKIGMGCINLVTVISKYTRVPATLLTLRWPYRQKVFFKFFYFFCL